MELPDDDEAASQPMSATTMCLPWGPSARAGGPKKTAARGRRLTTPRL